MRKKNSVGVGKYQCRRRRRRRCRCWQKYVNILGLVLGLGLGLGLWLGLGLGLDIGVGVGVGVGVWQIRRRRFLRLISSSPQVVNVSIHSIILKTHVCGWSLLPHQVFQVHQILAGWWKRASGIPFGLQFQKSANAPKIWSNANAPVVAHRVPAPKPN